MRRCESSNRKSRGNVERWHPGQLSQRWLRITIVFRNGIAPCKDYCTGGRKVSSAKLFDQFQGCSGGKLDLLSGRRGKFSHQSRFEIDNNTGTGRIFNVGNSSSANSFSFLNGSGDDRVSIVILGFSL